MKPLSLIALLLLCLSLGCNLGSNALKPLDLTSQGIPLTIKAPKDAKIVSNNLAGVMNDVTVEKGDYSLQILGVKTTADSAEQLKREYLGEVQVRQDFIKLIKDEPQGFIFESKFDSITTYDFRYVVLKNDRVYRFQAGIVGFYKLPQIERMYAAVKQSK